MNTIVGWNAAPFASPAVLTQPQKLLLLIAAIGKSILIPARWWGQSLWKKAAERTQRDVHTYTHSSSSASQPAHRFPSQLQHIYMKSWIQRELPEVTDWRDQAWEAEVYPAGKTQWQAYWMFYKSSFYDTPRRAVKVSVVSGLICTLTDSSPLFFSPSLFVVAVTSQLATRSAKSKL